jgi:hypothetical protein
MPPSIPLSDPQLAAAAAALAKWRSTRPRSSRIPEDLWSRAIELAERHGIAKVAVALKLDYTSLKRRLATTTASATASPSQATRRRLAVIGALSGLRRTRLRPATGPVSLHPGSL